MSYSRYVFKSAGVWEAFGELFAQGLLSYFWRGRHFELIYVTNYWELDFFARGTESEFTAVGKEGSRELGLQMIGEGGVRRFCGG